MDMELTDKVAWVTGATGAIGREIALGFAREGAKVAVSARSEDALAALVGEIDAGGGTAMAAVLDVTNPDAVKAAAAAVISEMGRIDVLATTVAVPAFGPFLEINGDVFRQALEVKYLGYINCFQAVLPHMAERASGAIVAITGTGGKQPINIHLPGGSVNAALNLLLKGLANEYGPKNIRVNAASPGPIMSERQQQMIDAGMGNPAKGVPLGRLGEAAEVADAVLFLASERAA
ncbi:MAG: SDR family oxidoreductase, partial [Alphaproteobacteria bacterium]|nr:SDR family oxidoreductase [Alphaproteobacteria bacterium]